LRDSAGALTLFGDIGEKRPEIVIRPAFYETHAGLRVRQNAGQRLVEFVYDRGRQLAEHRHAVQMCKLALLSCPFHLSLFQIGDIAADCLQLDDPASVVENQVVHPLLPSDAAVGSDDLVFGQHAAMRFNQLAYMFQRSITCRFW
jgi:hypothetical protein